AEVAERRLDHVINDQFGRNCELNGKRFDCIVFNDVLEHMIDPYSALVYAKESLVPNGRVVASIPNVRYFDNVWSLLIDGSWEYCDAGILDRTHLRFFTKKSIESMFVDLGYDIEVLKGINSVDWAHPELRQRFRFLNFLTMK